MAQPHDLHELIQALTPSEKRHFKVYASLHAKKKSNYEQLFDALNNWNTDYDESVFKQKNKGKPFLKNLAEEKSHLRELILKVVGQYFLETTKENIGWKHFTTIKFLESKGLRSQSLEFIDIAEKQVFEMEEYAHVFQLNAFKVTALKHGPKTGEDSPEKLREADEALLHKIGLQRKSKYIVNAYDKLSQSIGNIKSRDKIESLMKEADEMLADAELPNMARIRLVWAKQMFYFHESRFEEGVEFSLQALQLFTENEFKGSFTHWNYITTFSNLLGVALNADKLESLPELINFIEQFEIESLPFDSHRFHVLINAKLFLVNNTKALWSHPQIVKQAREGLKKFDGILTYYNKYEILLNIFCAEFEQGKYLNSLNVLHEIDELAGREKSYIQMLLMRRISEVACHILLKDYIVAENQLHNLKRFATANEIEINFIKVTFDLLHEIIKTQSISSEKVKQLHKLYRETEEPPNMFIAKRCIEELFIIRS